MGWEPAREASGGAWFSLYLGHLLEDPYDAVRLIAGRSLQRIPEFQDFSYDFLAGEKERAANEANALAEIERKVGIGGAVGDDMHLCEVI